MQRGRTFQRLKSVTRVRVVKMSILNILSYVTLGSLWGLQVNICLNTGGEVIKMASSVRRKVTNSLRSGSLLGSLRALLGI